jgi:hypothetical protein
MENILDELKRKLRWKELLDLQKVI